MDVQEDRMDVQGGWEVIQQLWGADHTHWEDSPLMLS